MYPSGEMFQNKEVWVNAIKIPVNTFEQIAIKYLNKKNVIQLVPDIKILKFILRYYSLIINLK